MLTNRNSTALLMALGVTAIAPACVAASALTIIDDPNASIGAYPNGGTDVYQTSGSTTVGTYWKDSHAYGFIKTGKTFQTITVPYGAGSSNYVYATGISGKTVVGIFYSSDLHSHGYTDTNGVFSQIDVPGSVQTQVLGISGRTIVGTAGYGTYGGAGYGFTLTNGLYTILDAPNATGYTEPNGIYGNTVFGLYGNGQGLGRGGVYHGFTESNGTWTTIDIPGATNYTNVTAAYGTTLAGIYLDLANQSHGFIDINGVFQSIDIGGATSTQIRGLSKTAAGYNILGNYVSNGWMHGFSLAFIPSAATSGTLVPRIFASPVPEPNSWATVIFGFFGIGSLLRRGQSDRRFSA